MQEQELTHYYKTTFTLKNGMQIEICHKASFKEVSELKSESGIKVVVMEGFITVPLLIEKSIEVILDEIAAIETMKEFRTAQLVPWPENIDIFQQADNKHSINCNCPECSVSYPLVEHKSTCAIHNNPPAGFASSVSDCDCDCGAVVPCAENKPVEEMTTKELVEDK